MVVDSTICKVLHISIFDSYEDANRVTRLVYGDNAFAEEYKYLVSAGDTFHDGFFWNTMEPDEAHEEAWEQQAEYIPTDSEQIDTLEAAQEEQTLAMAEVYALTSTLMASLNQ